MYTLIRNTSIVNEGKIAEGDVLICKDRIEKIAGEIILPPAKAFREINGEGLYLLPGVIDDQVHFREPGLTHKADILSESKAAVAGGVTSFMDMPNTIPNTLTRELLEQKYSIASRHSVANYSFFMGIAQDNLDEVLRIDNEKVCGISDDGLYFNNDEGILANYPDFLEKLFSRSDALIALHSEDDSIIRKNCEHFRQKYGNEIPIHCHPDIRSEEACYNATKRVVEISRKYNNRLHLLHISTEKETELFEADTKVREKRITAEACVHHLWFSNKDYDHLQGKIKWNPAVKTLKDADGLLQALIDNKIDIIATDHAPHTIEEKNGNYFQINSGGPLVQHALPLMLEFYHKGKISLEKVVEKMSHHVAEIYRIKERGYIREGYYADLVLVDLNSPWEVNQENLLFKCSWSPFSTQKFKAQVTHTFVNGHLVYQRGKLSADIKGKRLQFEKIR